MDFKFLLKEYPELGEALADFESRLLYLENSLPYSRPEIIAKKEPPNEWSKKQWDYVQQIKAELLHHRREYARLMAELDTISQKRKDVL